MAYGRYHLNDQPRFQYFWFILLSRLIKPVDRLRLTQHNRASIMFWISDMKLIYTTLMFFLYFLSGLTNAQVEQDLANKAAVEDEPVATQAVEVNGVKDPDWKRYRAMLKGLDAFDKYHALAPHAEHKFILKPRKAELPIKGITLRLASDEYSLPITLAEDGTFSLPRDAQAKQQDAEMLINRKKALFRWWPYVRSPQLAANQRRLGDLRLECEMFWAVNYDDAPFFARNFVRALGGPCTSKKVAISFPADFQGLKSATLIQGERRLVLPLDLNLSSFSAPLFDQNFADDAIIEIEYEDNPNLSNQRNYSGLKVSVAF